MSKSDLERIEELLKDLKEELALRGGNPLPTLLTKKHAAKEFSVGKTKLAELIKAGVVLTVPFGGVDMVPRSEIERLSHVEPAKVALSPKQQRLAASLQKIREPEPGAKEAVLRVRGAKNPKPTQDRAALEEMLKADAAKRRAAAAAKRA